MRADVKELVRLLVEAFDVKSVAIKNDDNEWEIWQAGRKVWTGPIDQVEDNQ